MNHYSSKQSGFTLIELLIVIAIIGILAAILVPNLLSARQRASDVAAIGCADALLKQAEIYAFDNDASYLNAESGLLADDLGQACKPHSITEWKITKATVNEFQGTVTSKTGAVVHFKNHSGIQVIR